VPVEVGCEAAHLAGMQAAVRAGLGVGLMATLGEGLDGLVARADLPAPEPVTLAVWPRRGLSPAVTEDAAGALVEILTRTRGELSRPRGRA
jgi:DNA-binding transcriptional LysR family regulator